MTLNKTFVIQGMDIPTFNDTTEYLHTNNWGITHVARPDCAFAAGNQSWGVNWNQPLTTTDQFESTTFWSWWVATLDSGYNFPMWIDMEYLLNNYANPNIIWGMDNDAYAATVGNFIDFMEENGGVNFKGYESEGVFDSGAVYLRGVTEKKVRQWVWAYAYNPAGVGPYQFDAFWPLHSPNDVPPEPPYSMTIAERMALCDELLYEVDWPWTVTDFLRVEHDVRSKYPTKPFGISVAVQDGAAWSCPPMNMLNSDAHGLTFEQITQISTSVMYYLYSQVGPIESWAVEAPISRPGAYVSDAISGPQSMKGTTCPSSQYPGDCRPSNGWATGVQQAQLVDSWPIVGSTPPPSEKFIGGI